MPGELRPEPPAGGGLECSRDSGAAETVGLFSSAAILTDVLKLWRYVVFIAMLKRETIRGEKDFEALGFLPMGDSLVSSVLSMAEMVVMMTIVLPNLRMFREIRRCRQFILFIYISADAFI